MHYPQWLCDFFQFNRIKLDKIIAQQYSEPKKTLFNNFLIPFQQQKKYFALPYVEQDKTVSIYLCGAYETRELIELVTIAKSALGSSYIAKYEIIYNSSDDYHAAKVLLQNFSSGVIRLTYYPTTSGDDIFTGFHLIQKLIKVVNHRPYFTQKTRRPVGRILREFHLAKEEGDIETVLSCFEEIKNNSSLGAKNLIFLEIQTLAILGKWLEIRQHPELKHLIIGLMPLYLLQNILDALGHAGGDLFLDPTLEITIDIKVLQNEYQKFSPIFTRLLELPKDPKYKRQWQQWLIGSILLGQHQYLEQLPKFIDIEWCGQLVQKVKDYGYFIKKREEKHSFLKLSVPKNLEQTRIYLNYCTSLAPEDWFDIWFYLAKITLEIRSYLDQDPYLKEKWDQIEAYCNKKIIYEWNNWFEQVIQSQGFDAEKLLIRLHNEYHTWTKKSFVEAQIVIILDSKLEQVQIVMRDALPILLEWLVDNQVNLTVKTILMLFSLLVEDEKNDPNDLQVFHELLKYWGNLRNNSIYDHQVIRSTLLLLKRCQLNPLYQLPPYQTRVEKIFDLLRLLDGIQAKDLQLLEEFKI